MTRAANARLAGFMFLFYIACGIASMVLYQRATRGEGIAAKLANIAAHAPEMRAVAVLSLLTIFAALALAVSLYALTRDQDDDLALFALSCRIVEGAVNAIPAIALLAVLAIALNAEGAPAQAVAGALLKVQGWTMLVGGSIFAVASTIYSYLFLRGRSIPVAMAWLGVIASVLLVVALPLQLIRVLEGPATYVIWLPMFVFEVTLGVWLLVKGN